MKEIKTRDSIKDIRVLDRTVNIGDRIKNTYVRTKEQAEQTQRVDADSPTGYAEDRAVEKTRTAIHDVGYGVRRQGKRLVEKTRQIIQKRHMRSNASDPEGSQQRSTANSKASASSCEQHVSESKSPDYTRHGRDFARESIRRQTEHNVSDFAWKEKRQGVKTVEHSMKQSACASEKTIRTSASSSIKTAQHSVKTAEQTSRAAIKTTQATAKTAAKTAQATARAVQRAAQAARVTVKVAVAAAKAITKAVVATVKGMIAAVKELMAAIAVGGWVAVVVIVVILLVASILGSVFGIFASEQGYDDSPSMPKVVSQINADFSAKINSIIEDNPHDSLVIDNAGSASMVANWNEVLAVCDILVATDPENPMEVATLDDTKVGELKTVFWDMNDISYSVDVVDVGTNEETGEPITETVLTITVSYKTVEDMISSYGFSADRAEQVRELLQPEYAELFQRLTGSYVDITLSAEETVEIMETLPKDLGEARKEVVLAAYSLLGKVNYFWGGKSLVIGWDSRWGTPMKVTADDSPTTGTVRPFGLDCSGFVDWVFYNANKGEYIIGHGGGVSDQYNYCDAIPWSSGQPGDLVFYPDCEHVGIVVKNDAGTLTIIHCASGYDNVVMTQHAQGNGFAFVGRPQIFDD